MMWNCGEMQEVPSWSCHQWLVFSSLSLESFLSSSFPPLTFGSTEHAFLWQSLQWYSFSLDLQDQLCGYNNCFVSSPPILNTNIELELLQLQARQATTTWNSVSYQAWSLNKPFQFCLQPACYLVHTQLRAHPKLFICKLILLMSDPSWKKVGILPSPFGWDQQSIRVSCHHANAIKSNVCFL